jgi:hypothetical protein
MGAIDKFMGGDCMNMSFSELAEAMGELGATHLRVSVSEDDGPSQVLALLAVDGDLIERVDKVIKEYEAENGDE